MLLSLSYTVSFSTNEARTQGSIRITSTTDFAGQLVNPALVEIGIGYIGPDGNPYRLDTVPQTGNIHPAVQAWAEYPLPTDINGLVQTGNYTVSYHAYSSTGPIDQTLTSVENLCTDIPTLCLNTNPDCLRLVVSATDATGWESAGWTVNSRAMVLQYPSITYHSNITGSGPTISTAGEPIWNGTWTVTSTVNVTKGNYTVTIATVKQFDVACNMDGCRLLCMFKAMYADYATAKEVGDPAAIAKINGKLLRLGMLSNFIAASINCGDDLLLNSLMDDFKVTAIGSATADCQCCDGCSEPQPLVPIWNSGGSAPTLLEGNNITLTLGVNTVTISVSQAFSDLVGQLFNTEVDSPDGSVVVTETISGILHTKHLSVAKPVRDNIRFKVRFDAVGPGWHVSDVRIQGTKFQNAITIAPNVANYIWNISGFCVADPTPYTVLVESTQYGIQPAYSNVYRQNSFAKPIVSDTSAASETLALTLMLTTGMPGYSGGRSYNWSVIGQFLTHIDVEFTITALNA